MALLYFVPEADKSKKTPTNKTPKGLFQKEPA
jgi:hypothetical protein